MTLIYPLVPFGEKYEIGRKLGEGGYGKVFLGTLKSEPKTEVAIKVQSSTKQVIQV